MGLRGLTLLEVIVAVAIVAVLSALALPAVWGRLGDARLSSSAHQLEAAVISVRAQAQREGAAVALVAAHGPGGMHLVAQRVDVQAALGTDGDSGEGEGRPGRTEGRRMLGSLPRGVMVGPRPVSAGIRGIDDDGETRPVGRRGDEPPPVRIAVALPDGSLAVPGPVLLRAGGAELRVRINRYTGVSTVERVRGSPVGDEGPDDFWAHDGERELR